MGSPQQPLPSPLHLPAFHPNPPIPNLLLAAPLQNLFPSPVVPHLVSSSSPTPGAGLCAGSRPAATSPPSAGPAPASPPAAGPPPASPPAGAAPVQRESWGRGHHGSPAAQRHPAAPQRGRRHGEPPPRPAAAPPPSATTHPAGCPCRFPPSTWTWTSPTFERGG